MEEKMITTSNPTILPLNLPSLSKLISSDGGSIKDIDFKTEYLENKNQVQLTVFTHFLNPDSVQLTINKTQINLAADVTFNLELENKESIALSKKINTSIPLPSNAKFESIYSNITDDSIIFYIDLN